MPYPNLGGERYVMILLFHRIESEMINFSMEKQNANHYSCSLPHVPPVFSHLIYVLPHNDRALTCIRFPEESENDSAEMWTD